MGECRPEQHPGGVPGQRDGPLQHPRHRPQGPGVQQQQGVLWQDSAAKRPAAQGSRHRPQTLGWTPEHLILGSYVITKIKRYLFISNKSLLMSQLFSFRMKKVHSHQIPGDVKGEEKWLLTLPDYIWLRSLYPASVSIEIPHKEEKGNIHFTDIILPSTDSMWTLIDMQEWFVFWCIAASVGLIKILGLIKLSDYNEVLVPVMHYSIVYVETAWSTPAVAVSENVRKIIVMIKWGMLNAFLVSSKTRRRWELKTFRKWSWKLTLTLTLISWQ